MPIYEYRCRQCGSKFERLVRSFGAAEIKCPQCGSEQTEKMISVFATGGSGPTGSGPAPSAGCGTGGFS